ncbi:MAG: hypothetical protein DCF22_10260 [Leptolyngbya sp.]|nr:MAG: hypothetical protein DCF22_10260 [Leptolyngbya sp.]
MNIAAKCDLPGYCITEQIYAGTKTLVYRGIREFDQHLVVIKLLRNEYPSFSELVQFRNQYTIAKNLRSVGIIKPYSLELYRNGYALVMEDFGGVSLSKYARGQEKRSSGSSLIHDPLTIADFLAIALQLCDILSELYHHRIIHKDIKPANILINPETKQVKLIDFSIASLLPRETQDIQNPNGLEGTLAYLSPEQTGRMNRGIDYRSDYYSLGVTFFELLTGQLPFQSNDPMELVHCHIAKQPPASHRLNSTVPTVLSAIVSKLMAKNAEDRYQSALGLKHDLEQCLTQWQKTDTITAFTLGQRDITDRFLIPEKLYGREQEVAALLSAFERVSGSVGSELILVAGFSGIGKTAIVNEVHKPIVRQRGYFIKGKYDQFQRDIPFSAFVQAFRDLMGQLLSESDLQLEQWKTKILIAVGENGQVLIEVIPELERIIGTQPSVSELSGDAAQNRFNQLFSRFVQVFTTPEHPLVIFIDDLQWADSASLKLMHLLMGKANPQYLLFIGAYRDNEVTPAHPFMLTVDQLQKSGAAIATITLAPLTQRSVNQLVADTLSCSLALANPLTDLIVGKTKGNPFFTTQFLKALYEDGLITFNLGGNHWECAVAQVRSLALTEDIVEFMAIQLQKLPAETQEILKLAACIGNQFDLVTLAIVHEKSQTETASDLWKALQEGLILPQSDVYKFYQEPEARRQELKEPVIASGSCYYKFLHDRVQQAAYSLIPDPQKQLTHFKIGQRLLDATPAHARDEKLFEIVNQLNQGASLIVTLADREQLATLNLRVGQKAKASTAYTSALDYAVRGIQLLTADGWQHRYSLTLALYELATEVAFLSGDFEQMQQLAAIVLQQAQRLLDTIKIYEVKILAEVAQSRQPEAIKTALTVLERFGMEFPAQPSAADIGQSLQETQSLLAEKQLEELLNLPEMVDPDALAVIQLLAAVTAAVYQAVPALLPLIVCQQVKLSAQHGNATVSTLAYAWYGVILCTSGEIDLGNRVGQLALDLLAQSKHQGFKASTINMVYPFVKPWKYALRESLAPLLEGYHSGLEMGALEYAAYCAYNYCALSFFMGKELVALESETAIYGQALAQLKQEVAYNYLNVGNVINLLFCPK